MNTISPESSQLFRDLNQVMDEILQTGEEEREGLARLQYLTESLQNLVPPILAVGTAAHTRMEDKATASFHDYLICYEWADCAKSFLILYRDVLFQEQKAWQQVSAKITDLANFRRLMTQSNEVIREAHAEFRYFIEQETKTSADLQKRIDKWQLQHNPWPVYREQINQFPEQAEDLLKQCKKLWNASGVFVVIYSHVMDNFKVCHSQIDQLQSDILALTKTVEEAENYPVKNVVSTLDHLHSQMRSISGIESFTDGLEEHLGKLPEATKIFVGTKNGTVFYKDLELQKRTRSWLESEVMSDIYELNTIRESIQNKVNLTKVNLSNRIVAGEEEKDPLDEESILSALQMFLKSLEKSRQKVADMEVQVGAKLRTNFDLAGVFKDSFLPVSMQYTLSQYGQGERWRFVKDWLQKQSGVFQQFRKEVREERALSVSEKIVRVMRYRTFKEANSHYTNMFLTKGYIGDSFWVGRSEELRHLTQVVENWRLGFRGSVLITGKRFSGKTLLGDLVEQKHFPNNAIKLKPKSKIQIAGRHFDSQYDLQEVLDFVIKNTLNQPAMVLIDDLELWEDDKVSLGKNVEYLLQTIDQYTSRLFFVITVSNWLNDHLQKVFDVRDVFQGEINVDRMGLEEVQQAILTRHSATHMELVDTDEREEIDAAEIRKKISQVFRATNGNIGEALQKWAYSIRKYDEEKVVLKEEVIPSLPNFLNLDSALLLRTIMMEKRTNEYRLRKQFGPAFNDKYKVILQRLSSLGVVRRSVSGWLEINPVLVNDIGEQLEQQTDFRFQNQSVWVEDLKL